MFKTDTTLLTELFLIMGVYLALVVSLHLAGPPEAQAGDPKSRQSQQTTQKTPPKVPPSQESPGARKPGKARSDKTTVAKPESPPPSGSASRAAASHPSSATTAPKRAARPQPSSSRKTAERSTPAAGSQFHGIFVEALKAAPFPLAGKDADPHFFDSIDAKTGERFRTSRFLERLSEKDHYRDSSVLFHVPPRYNPTQPFSYVVFFHGNRSDVRQTVTEYRLDEQVNRSGKNVILVLPQLARNAADSSPGKFSKRNAFRTFMQEAALVLATKLGKKHQRQFEQAPLILVAFSGGYKPLACTLDRGGAESRIRGILLLDGLYEDLYIFGKWLLQRSMTSFFVNIYTEGSPCEEKTTALAQFLREHRRPFKDVWPKSIKNGQVALVKSPHEHLQVPLEGPPREPLAELLRSLKN